jgi:hypothetical protein
VSKQLFPDIGAIQGSISAVQSQYKSSWFWLTTYRTVHHFTPENKYSAVTTLYKVKTYKSNSLKKVRDRHQWNITVQLSVYSLVVTLCSTKCNTNKFYILHRLHLCVLYGSQNK